MPEVMSSGYHQGCALALCLGKVFPFSSFMGTGKSKALSSLLVILPSTVLLMQISTHLGEGCTAKAAVKTGMSLPQSVNQYQLHSIH